MKKRINKKNIWTKRKTHPSWTKANLIVGQSPPTTPPGCIRTSVKLQRFSIKSLTEDCLYLKNLSLVGAGLDSLEGFPELNKLIKLNLSDNLIKDLETLEPLKELENLQNLDLRRNKVTKLDNYREKIFALLPGLIVLDGIVFSATLDQKDSLELKENGEEDFAPTFDLNHTGKGTVACGFCQKAFTELADLNKHIIIRHPGGPYVCTTCGRSYLFKYTFDLHRQTHIFPISNGSGQTESKVIPKRTLARLTTQGRGNSSSDPMRPL